MTSLAAPRWLTDEQQQIWRAYLLGSALLQERIDADLRPFGLDRAEYEILVVLSETDGRRLRMAELADAVLLSRSGVTRLVDRLEVAGMVTRERFESDGRGVVAVLTTKGVDTLREAARTHLGGVMRHFVEHFDPEELREFGTLCSRLAE
jgi:DNA-binding MarR family transcriptional regulator